MLAAYPADHGDFLAGDYPLVAGRGHVEAAPDIELGRTLAGVVLTHWQVEFRVEREHARLQLDSTIEIDLAFGISNLVMPPVAVEPLCESELTQDPGIRVHRRGLGSMDGHLLAQLGRGIDHLLRDGHARNLVTSQINHCNSTDHQR